MKPDRAPARVSDAVSVDVDGEILIYHRLTGHAHRLDPIGAIVWQYLDGETTVDALVGDLSAAFGVEQSVVQNDVAHLLERLEQAFLLADGPSPSPISEPRVLTNPPSP